MDFTGKKLILSLNKKLFSGNMFFCFTQSLFEYETRNVHKRTHLCNKSDSQDEFIRVP